MQRDFFNSSYNVFGSDNKLVTTLVTERENMNCELFKNPFECIKLLGHASSLKGKSKPSFMGEEMNVLGLK